MGQKLELNKLHNLKAAMGTREQMAIEVKYVEPMNDDRGIMNLISLNVDNDNGNDTNAQIIEISAKVVLLEY